jgi:ABC-2 type transport system permease protein
MRLFAQSLVIARRDFLSIVATPTFLLFLLAPLIMLGFGALGGASSVQLAENAGKAERIVAIVPENERAAFVAVDTRLREVAGRTPRLIAMPANAAHGGAAAGLRADADVLAILEGSAAAPRIAQREPESAAGRYLATVADTVAREGAATAAVATPVSRPTFSQIAASGTGRAAQSGLGYGAVFGIFILTLLLAGQTVGMLAEEKGNKVIEVLAAAVPLESVFFGKLLGMLGVALLFITFWGVLIGGVAVAAVSQIPAAAALATLNPAIGWPLFLTLGLIYFLAAFFLLGAVFLGVGAQASTVREIQMLSLPITFFQIGMFTLASAAANAPDTRIAMIAQLVPWSSPFAMAARGATDASLWPHVAALGWQALWIAITIFVSVRLFRAGVLRSGGSWWPWTRGAKAAVVATAAAEGTTSW